MHQANKQDDLYRAVVPLQYSSQQQEAGVVVSQPYESVLEPNKGQMQVSIVAEIPVGYTTGIWQESIPADQWQTTALGRMKFVIGNIDFVLRELTERRDRLQAMREELERSMQDVQPEGSHS